MTQRYEEQRRVQDLEAWRATSGEVKHRVAHNVAIDAHRNARSDPNTYSRIYSRLMNGVETPADYGQERWAA